MKKSESKKKNYFVLENNRGQVIRSFYWPGTQLKMVVRHDTGRIYPVDSTKDLEKKKIPFTLLADVKKTSLQRRKVNIANVGQLRWVSDVEKVSPTVIVPKDSDQRTKIIAKWTAMVQTGVLALLIILGLVFEYFNKPEEPRVVKITKLKKERLVVKPSPKKRVKKVAKVRRKRKRVQRKQPKVVKRVRKPTPITSVGALAVLGNNKPSRHSGLKTARVKRSRGPGLGGSAGSSGSQKSLFAKGLVAAPLGPSARVKAQGGVGTRGAGGGKAGYGKMSMVGSSQAYSVPVESEAIIEGGLDREQIAEVIRRHIGQVRYCYEKGLQSSPKLSGRVSVKFKIAPSGRVSVASVSRSSLRNSRVENCIVRRLKGWRFPKPRGGVVVKVNYPFVLKRSRLG